MSEREKYSSFVLSCNQARACSSSTPGSESLETAVVMLVLHCGSLYREDMALSGKRSRLTPRLFSVSSSRQWMTSFLLILLPVCWAFLPCGPRNSTKVEQSIQQTFLLHLSEEADESHGRPLTPTWGQQSDVWNPVLVVSDRCDKGLTHLWTYIYIYIIGHWSADRPLTHSVLVLHLQ